MTPNERIAALREQIAYHSDKYYNEDNPEITDHEFDMLMRELKQLEKENPSLVTADSPTQKVGGIGKADRRCFGAAQCTDAESAGHLFQRGGPGICRADERAA